MVKTLAWKTGDLMDLLMVRCSGKKLENLWG